MHDDDDRLAVELPLAVHQGGAQGFHLSGDELVGALGIVGIQGLDLAGGGNVAGIVSEGAVQRGVLRDGQAAEDFLRDVIAVDQHVHGLADLGDAEGIQAAILEGRAIGVEGQLVVGAEGDGVAQVRVGLDGLEQHRIIDGVGVDIDLAGLQLGDSRFGLVNAREDNTLHRIA